MHRYIEPLFDLALAAALWLMLPVLVRQFSTPDMYNGMILSAGFGALILGTYFLSQVEAPPSGQKQSEHPSKRNGCLLFMLAIGVGNFLYKAIRTCQGMNCEPFDPVSVPWDGISTWQVLILEISYVVFIIAYLAMVFASPRLRYLSTTTQGIVLRIAGMAGAQLGMLMLWAGFLGKQEIDFADLYASYDMSFQWSWRTVIYIVAMSLLAVMLWLPSRLIIRFYNPSRLAWVTYIFTALIAGYLAARL